MHSQPRVTASVTALALFALSSTTVLAATEQEITAALEAALESSQSGLEVTLGTPTAEGDALVYRDSVIKATDDDSASEIKIGTLTLTGADVNADGGIVADAMVGENLTMTGKDNETATVEKVEVVNLETTPAKDGDTASSKVDSMSATGINVTSADGPPVKVESITFNASDYVGRYPSTMSFAVNGVEVDVAAAGAEDPSVQQLKALGYDKIVLGITGSGKWDESAGTMTVQNFTIDAQDMGSFTIAGVFGGFSPDVMAELQKPEPSHEVMQKITLNEASIGFTDASITNKLLDMQAQQMNADRATFVEQITAALPLMLSAVGNPGFQEKIAAAATMFLKDPQNITISVKPDQPVDMMTLMMTGQTAPQTLPDVLKAEVTSNQPAAQ
jgi:hypothetical protein